jgi:hypothetical protein
MLLFLFPFLYLFIEFGIRIIVKELPENVLLIFFPANLIVSVLGETFVGSSSVFSSRGVAEVSVNSAIASKLSL